MRTYKIIALALVAGMATACNFVPNASKRQIEDLKQELSEMKESRNALQDSYIQQNAEISQILDALASITGQTASLRTDVETGSADIRQADQISTDIELIKNRIDNLENSYKSVVSKNREFQKMIKGFKEVISEQETQISSLKEEIATKDLKIAEQSETIKSHENTISAQDETIRQKNEELQATVEKQARMLYEAGCQLEEIGDNAPEVSWKKNKEKVDVMTQDIYRKALVYYQQAYEAGYEPAKAAIAAIQAKIEAN